MLAGDSTLRAVGTTVILLASSCLAGCFRAEAPHKTTAEHSNLTAEEILEQVRQTYRSAQTYTDQGLLTLQYSIQGQMQREAHPYSVSFQRPGQLHVRIFTAELRSNGQMTTMSTSDMATRHMDNQVMAAEAPFDTAINRLFSDPIAGYFLSGEADIPVSNQVPDLAQRMVSPVLGLLTGWRQPDWTNQPKSLERLANQTLGGTPCLCLRATTDLGVYTAWIDPEQMLIRKLELPRQLLDRQLDAVGQIDQLSLVAEFNGAQIDRGVNRELFSTDLTAGQKQVHHFVALPQPFPSELIGHPTPRFRLSRIDGTEMTGQSLRGSITVLLWFNLQPNCLAALPYLDQVAARYQADPRVKILAVCTDSGAHVPNKTLQQVVTAQKVLSPVVRDSDESWRQHFGIDVLPTVVVLDKNGVMQFYKEIGDQALSTEVAAVIGRLQRGHDIAGEMRRDYQRYLQSYQDQLQQASTLRQMSQPLPGSPTLLARKAPRHFELKRIWSNSQVQMAGNLLVTDSETGAARIHVLDGFRTVCILNMDGQLVQTIPLDLPEKVGVTQLRTIRLGNLRYFLAGATHGQQVFLFNHQWKRIATYPPQPTPQRIQDFQLHDSNGDHQPEIYVGFWERGGIHHVSAIGQKLTDNQTFRSIRSLEILNPSTASQTEIIGTDEQGQLFQIDRTLRSSNRHAATEDRFDQIVAGTDHHQAATKFCGLTRRAETLHVTGFDRNRQPIWTTPLCGGMFAGDVRFVSSGRLVAGDKPNWVIARPNGTIYVLADNGQLVDHFADGRSIRGISVMNLRQTPVLLLSTSQGVDAWRLDRKATGVSPTHPSTLSIPTRVRTSAHPGGRLPQHDP